MTFIEAVKTVYFNKAFTYSGRASRSEYWWAYLALLILVVFVFVIPFLIDEIFTPSNSELYSFSFLLNILRLLFAIPFMFAVIALISANVRRFHDVNLSGWWVLVAYIGPAIPLLGIVVVIASFVVTLLKGTDGPNLFGPDPLKPDINAEIFA